MPWWFKSFLIVFAGLVLLLLGDVAGKFAKDAAACRLMGAAMMGLGVYVAVNTPRPNSTSTPSRARTSVDAEPYTLTASTVLAAQPLRPFSSASSTDRSATAFTTCLPFLALTVTAPGDGRSLE